MLGTLASLAVARYHFFGREVITFAVILPIALPGIVTGLALQATILDVLGPLGVRFGLMTIVIGHATFCIVVIYNNVIARLRRTAGNLDEASADLGADTWQTFRYVLLPQLRTAMLAGGLLAFALSFDEVIVTIFTSGAEQTLPIWIFAALARPDDQPDRQRRRTLRAARRRSSRSTWPCASVARGRDAHERAPEGRSDGGAGSRPRRRARPVTPVPIGHVTPVPPRPQ